MSSSDIKNSDVIEVFYFLMEREDLIVCPLRAPNPFYTEPDKSR